MGDVYIHLSLACHPFFMKHGYIIIIIIIIQVIRDTGHILCSTGAWLAYVTERDKETAP